MGKINKGGREISKNEKILLGAIGIIGVLAIDYMFIIDPGFKKTEPLEKEIGILKQELKATNNIDEKIVEKKEMLKGLKVEYDKAAKALPKGDKYPLLSKDLNDMAKNNRLKLVSVDLKEAETVEKDPNNANQGSAENTNTQDNSVKSSMKGLKKLNVTISLDGKREDVLKFINEVESADRILIVDSMTTKKDEKNKELTALNITYYISSGDDSEKENYDFN